LKCASLQTTTNTDGPNLYIAKQQQDQIIV